MPDLIRQAWDTSLPALALLFSVASLTCLEAALRESNRATSYVFLDILTRNLLISAIAAGTYLLLGFDLMYPGEAGLWWTGSFEQTRRFLTIDLTVADVGMQTTYAATASMLFSAMLASRWPRNLVLAACPVFVLISYCLFGRWHWGGGWLHGLGFVDHYGATAIAGVAGGAALGAMLAFAKPAGPHTSASRQPSKGQSACLVGAALFYIVLPLLFWVASALVFRSRVFLVMEIPLRYALGTLLGLLGARTAFRFVKTAWPSSIPRSASSIMGAIAAASAIEAGIETFSAWWIFGLSFTAGAGSVCLWLLLRRRGWRDPVCGLSSFALGGAIGTLAARSPDFYQPAIQLIGAFTAFLWAGVFWFGVVWIVQRFSRLPRPQATS